MTLMTCFQPMLRGLLLLFLIGPHYSNLSLFSHLCNYSGTYDVVIAHWNHIQLKGKCSHVPIMSCCSYPWHWCCCRESLHPWKRGWSPAVGWAVGCDRESSRTVLMPEFWRLRPSSSPAPSPRVSDSTWCDYRGSGTWGGRWEQILSKGTDGCL